jgi:hypothetical protein
MTILDGATGAVLTGVTQVYQAHDVGCGRRDDGTVWCWPTTTGAVPQRLGRGPSPGTLIVGHAYPVLLPPTFAPATPITGVDRLNQGSSTCYLGMAICAVRNDGTLYCWGDGESGGGGNLFNDGAVGQVRYYATQILAAAATALDGVTAVTTGSRHACVLRSGDVYCWGANIGGPLGQGNQTLLAYPASVPLPGQAEQLGAGPDFTCARISDTVYCWGHNNQGQIGIGVPADTSDGCINFCKLRPAQVIDEESNAISGIVDLNVNYQGACGKRANGSMLCWGFGVGNVATPLLIGANPPEPVSLQTSCGTNSVTQELRYLSTSGVLRRAATEITNICP